MATKKKKIVNTELSWFPKLCESAFPGISKEDIALLETQEKKIIRLVQREGSLDYLNMDTSKIKKQILIERDRMQQIGTAIELRLPK